MYRLYIFIAIIFILIIPYIINCGSDNATEPDNILPVCSITSPLNRSIFHKGETIEISVDASDENGTIRYVQFVIDGEIVFWDNKSPFVYEWDTSDEAYGSHIVSAIGKDDDGETSEHTIRIDLQYLYIRPENTGDGWEVSTLGNESIDTEQICEMMTYGIEDIEFLYSILIIRNENLVFEQYFNGQTKDDANNLWSTSKCYLSALTGIALRENYIADLNQKMMDFFPEYDSPGLDSRKNDITVEHLLTMMSGIPGEFDVVPGFGGIFGLFLNSRNWIRFSIDLPLVANPGDECHYSTMSTHILSGLLSKATGVSIYDFAVEYLFEPLNVDIRYWEQDPNGYYKGGWAMYFTPRDMARFGLLYLNNGVFEGQQIIPAGWIEKSIQSYFGGNLTSYGIVQNWGYGYQWDIGRLVQYNVFYRLGRGGQLIFCIPEIDMIIITTAHGELYDKSDEEIDNQIIAIFNLIRNYILPAVR